VITGFGRLGTGFGADFYGVVPDMLNFAKAVTNGVIPLGGVICRDKLYDAMMTGPEHVIEFFHGYTYSGHPVACAAAIATLDLFEEEDLFAARGRWGRRSATRCTRRCGASPTWWASARWASPARWSSRPPGRAGQAGYDIFLDCFHHGALVRAAGENLVLAPPFIVEQGHIDQMVSTLAASIRKHA
jgi:beta-alanine--pyruvate transaminase